MSRDILLDTNRKHFHSVVAQLLYLSRRARVDIQLVVLFLCTRVKQLTKQDERMLDRLIGFLPITKFKKRILTGKG